MAAGLSLQQQQKNVTSEEITLPFQMKLYPRLRLLMVLEFPSLVHKRDK